jgi:hypothetical protein
MRPRCSGCGPSSLQKQKKGTDCNLPEITAGAYEAQPLPVLRRNQRFPQAYSLRGALWGVLRVLSWLLLPRTVEGDKSGSCECLERARHAVCAAIVADQTRGASAMTTPTPESIAEQQQRGWAQAVADVCAERDKLREEVKALRVDRDRWQASWDVDTRQLRAELENERLANAGLLRANDSLADRLVKALTSPHPQ